jgi:hypothetical protein
MEMPRPVRLSPAVLLAFHLAAGPATAGGVPLAADAAASRAFLDRARAPETCLVADLARAESGELLAAESSNVLPPGRYRFHAPVAAAPLGTLAVGLLKLRLTAGPATRECSAVQFALDDEFSDLTLDFTVATARRVPLRLDWRVEESKKTKGLLGRRALELQAAAGGTGPQMSLPGEAAAADDDLALDAEGSEVPIAEARAKRFRLLATGVHVERLSPLAVEVRPDKLVYRPGDPDRIALTLRNAGAAPAAAACRLELVAGLADPAPLWSGPAAVPAGGAWTLTLTNRLDTARLRWGAELRLTAELPGVPAAVGRSVFAVSSNLWETAIIAAHPAHMAAFDDPARARAAALELRQKGYTGFEAFFWAPCDLLEFTPDEELFFSGQTAYPGTRAGTSNLVAACHEQGLCATFYANLWGGSGPPALEVMRRHPDWFGNANHNTYVLDDWDLLGPSQMDMGDRKIRAPGIAQWCFNQLYIVPPEGVFRYHAREIVESHRRFGWDGIRYDSYYSRYWSVRAMRLIRPLVEKDVPGFGFGYNSFAWADYRAGALDDMVGGGGLVMGEGIRIERSHDLMQFAREILSWRDVIWAYGGHGPGMLFRPTTDDEEMPPLGVEYQASLILAGGGHLYYDAVESERAQYAAFALRYSEFLYNNRMRALKAPEQIVTFGPGARWLEWPAMARTVSLGGPRRRLVLPLINTPADPNPFSNKGMKAPPPVRRLPVGVSLPPGATVAGVWLLHADPEPWHEPLPHRLEDGTVRFELPDIRFWGTVVLDFDAEQPLPSPVSLKEKSDTYIQDWRVLGPFPNDLAMSAVTNAGPPEARLDLRAEYPGAGGRPVRWLRAQPAGAPALGRLPLDFRDALDCHEGAPGCAYAYTELQSDTDREVWLMGKADDTLALWVNGAPVEFKGGCGEFQDVDEGRAAVRLQKGRNTVLAKVCEKWLYWLLALRVADAEGNPITAGLTVGASE